MSKKKEFDFDHVTFSVIQIKADQDHPVPSQRILQTVTRGGVTKRYATAQAYVKTEMFDFMSSFINKSYEKSIMKNQSGLAPVKGGRNWVHFNDDTLAGNVQPLVNPETFE